MLDTRQKLLRMANQIADFFAPYKDDEAVAGIHEHIHNFWTPGMRREFRAFVGEEPEGLNPRIAAAMKRFDVAPDSPIDKATATASPAEGGQAASDAG